MVQSTKQSNLADNDQRFVRIGVDVGGTNTDAVVMCDNTVLAWHKTQTTEDISTGVVDAIRHVLINSDISTQAIQAVMVGSTHFINAILQRRELQKSGRYPFMLARGFFTSSSELCVLVLILWGINSLRKPCSLVAINSVSVM